MDLTAGEGIGINRERHTRFPKGPSTDMIHSAVLLTLLLVHSSAIAAGAPASGEMRSPTQEEKNFYANVVLPAMTAVRKAMPPAPQGWIVESETPLAPHLPDLVSGDRGRLWFSYAISYKRVADVENERKRLEEVLVDARKEFHEAAKAQADALTIKRAEAEEALKKAAKKKDHPQETRLKKDLEDIDGRLRVISEETERAIAAETEDYLVRDTVLKVRLTVNETTAAFPDARYFSRPRAAYALKKEGGRVGLTGWKQDQVLLLYGDWSDAGKDTFRGKVEQRPFAPKVRTIAIAIESDPSRMDQFLQHTGMRDILGMLK